VTTRLIQIGVGIRGGQWAEIVKDHPGIECVAYVDADDAALEKVRRLNGDGARCYRDLDQALGEVSADAALIATPSVLHKDHAMRALRAGLSVMVEKPFALNVEDASKVLACARESGRQILVAENYRYWPSERTVRHLIAEGRIGRIDSATLVDRRHMPSRTEGPWLAGIEYPQLQEIAIHHFDSLRYFLGLRATSITVRAWNPPWSDYRHGANTEAMIDFEGVRVQYLGTMLSHRFAFSLWIEGERGVIWTNRNRVFCRAAGSRLFRPVPLVKTPAGDRAKYPKGGTASLLNSLRDVVEHGTIPETNGLDNIWNVAMVEAGKRSDIESRTVRLDEVYSPEPAS
jgi:predicted dehydrogenase